MNLAETISDWCERVKESKRTFVWHAGVFAFGVPFGFLFSMFIVNSNDIANHPLWEKMLSVIGMTLIGGPVTGWFWGQLMWALKPIWGQAKKQQTSDTTRIDALEERVADLEEEIRGE